MSSSAAAHDHQPARGRDLRRVISASLIGTSLEWYDFFLYGTAAALIFNQLFFPTFDPLVGTLLAFATYAVGFVARPIGGIVFGHYGDRIGRRKILVITLMLMGGATFLIGCLPTYDSIGVAAPILLVTLRFVQGLGLGGEWGGAVLMVAEHGDERRRGLYSSWPQVGVPAGQPARLRRAGAAGRGAVGVGLQLVGLADAVPAQRGADRRRPLHPPARPGVAALPGARGDGREGAGAAGQGRQVLPAPARDRDRGALRRRRGLLHVRAVHPHLRHDGARPVEEPGAQRRARRLGAAAVPDPLLRPPVGPGRPPARVPRGRGRRGDLGVRLLPAAGHEVDGADRARRRRRAGLPRRDVRAAGRVHHRAVRDGGALLRRVARLPGGGRPRRRARADHRRRPARPLPAPGSPSRSTCSRRCS